MKFTIGTVSNSLNLEEDLRLIKSSILYADEIEMIGMIEYALYKYLPDNMFNARGLEEMMRSVRTFVKCLQPSVSSELLQQLEQAENQLQAVSSVLKRNKHHSKQEVMAQYQLKSYEKKCQELLLDFKNQLFTNPGTCEIQELVDKHLITICDYGFNDFDVNRLSGGYFAQLMNAMYNGTAYPLFDRQSSDIIGSIVNTKLLDIGRLDSSVIRHAGVASEILMTLPTLESASIDELLALKKENEKPLINFRKAIYEFSSQIQSMPWSVDFQYDCLKLYNTEVLPNIQEINETLANTSVLKNIAKRAVADEEIRRKSGYAMAGLTTAIASSSDLFGVFTALQMFIVAVGIAAVSKEAFSGFLKMVDIRNQAVQEIDDKKEKASKNVMYYYYLASKI